jgi:hypothetical protein
MTEVLLKIWGESEGNYIYHMYEIPNENKKKIKKLQEQLLEEKDEKKRQKIMDKIDKLVGPMIGSIETDKKLYSDRGIRDLEGELMKTEGIKLKLIERH